MPEIIKDTKTFRADRAWGARDIARIDGASVRLHWTDQPYEWHVNDGEEVFVVLLPPFAVIFDRLRLIVHAQARSRVRKRRRR